MQGKIPATHHFITEDTPLDNHRLFLPYRTVRTVPGKAIIISLGRVVLFSGDVTYKDNEPLHVAMKLNLRNNNEMVFVVYISNRQGRSPEEISAVAVGVGLKTYVTLGITIKSLHRVNYTIHVPDGEEPMSTELENYLILLRKMFVVYGHRSTCGACGKNRDLKSCGGCKVVRFCSVKCQREVFASHRKSCKKMGHFSTEVIKCVDDVYG